MALEQFVENRLWSALGLVFSRIFIMAVLPLLAWGVDELPGFFSSPPRSACIVFALVQAVILGWLVYLEPPRLKHKPNPLLSRWHANMFEIIFLLAAYGDRRGVLTWAENIPLRWLGAGIYLAGILLLIWAAVTWVSHLRRAGSQACDDPVLLEEGVYRWIRFPQLLSLAVYCLGYVFVFRSWAALVLMVPLAASIVHRMDDLEIVFDERYGRAWERRRRSSRRILPFLY